MCKGQEGQEGQKRQERQRKLEAGSRKLAVSPSQLTAGSWQLTAGVVGRRTCQNASNFVTFAVTNRCNTPTPPLETSRRSVNTRKKSLSGA